ncbi:MAG: FeoA family protein [Proteobacteria bacterium]|nr:FeoA family protein [Pseudomonadota bacterium]
MSARPEPTCKALGTLRYGDRALIIDVESADPIFNAKLAARGLVPGVEVGVLRSGDPFLVSMDESRWAMTRDDANTIQVNLIKPTGKSLLRKLWPR